MVKNAQRYVCVLYASPKTGTSLSLLLSLSLMDVIFPPPSLFVLFISFPSVAVVLYITVRRCEKGDVKRGLLKHALAPTGVASVPRGGRIRRWWGTGKGFAEGTNAISSCLRGILWCGIEQFWQKSYWTWKRKCRLNKRRILYRTVGYSAKPMIF